MVHSISVEPSTIKIGNRQIAYSINVKANNISKPIKLSCVRYSKTDAGVIVIPGDLTQKSNRNNID
jgi:hypothetical protein